jgi:hypothetical protein
MNSDTDNEVARLSKTMNPNEINKRIAIACGWYVLPNGFPSELWEHPSGKRAYESDFNYHGDLNAMHEAENALKDEQKFPYMEEIYNLSVRDIFYGSMHFPCGTLWQCDH